MKTFEEFQADAEAYQARRLARVRAAVTERGGTVTHAALIFHISGNPKQNRHRFPWRVTTFTKDRAGFLMALGHTEHTDLDLPEDHGAYYKSAVWEVASQIGEIEP